jgi:hypothetical protein
LSTFLFCKSHLVDPPPHSSPRPITALGIPIYVELAQAWESCKTYCHPGRSVSLLDAHVLKEDRPSHWAKSPQRSLATERPVVSGQQIVLMRRLGCPETHSPLPSVRRTRASGSHHASTSPRCPATMIIAYLGERGFLFAQCNRAMVVGATMVLWS